MTASADPFISGRREGRPPILATLLALAGAAALFIAVFAIADLVHAARTRGWPTVPGTILSSEIRHDPVEYHVGSPGVRQRHPRIMNRRGLGMAAGIAWFLFGGRDRT